MNNLLFSLISDDEFSERFYGKDIFHDCFGAIGKELQKIFSEPERLLPTLGSSIRGDLFVFRQGVACKESIFYNQESNFIHWDRIWSMYKSENATIYLRGLQKYMPDVNVCLSKLKKSFPNRIPFANIFISPPGAIGLNAHFDPTEFFVFQINGGKQWNTWHAPPYNEAEEMMPDEMANFCQQVQEKSQPNHIYNLQAGDCLYLPIYWIHAPHTTSLPSSHITVGLAHPELKNRASKVK